MAELTRHVGKLNNTGQKCVIIYRQVPGEPDSAIIVQSDQLPDMYHDNLMRVLREPQTQQAAELSEILSRRQFASGDNMLNALHSGSFLRKTDVDNVTLYPYPNQPVDLRLVNEQMGVIENTLTSAPPGSAEATDSTQAAIDILEGKVETPVTIPVTNTAPVDEFGEVVEEPGGIAPVYTDETAPVQAEAVAPDQINIPDGSSDPAAIASNLLSKASDLENEAVRLREAAYTVDPSTKPTKGRPKYTKEEKARQLEITNAKRRQKYKEKQKK